MVLGSNPSGGAIIVLSLKNDMKDEFFAKLKEKLQGNFPNVNFETEGTKLIARGISTPVIPKEVNQIINEAASDFNLRKGQVAYLSKNSSMEIVLNLD